MLLVRAGESIDFGNSLTSPDPVPSGRFARPEKGYDYSNANSPLSRAKKHPDFQVTSCHQNDSTNIDFAYNESE
jgi:hypothetical protein